MMYISHINECISNDIIYSYKYVYMKCVLTNGFKTVHVPESGSPVRSSSGSRHTLTLEIKNCICLQSMNFLLI